MPKVANTSPQFTDTMALVPASFIPAVKAWKFGAAQGAEGGVKSFPLTCGGSELMLQMQGCISPFDASDPPGGSSSRKTLTLRLPQVWDESFGLMETALVKEVTARSATLFGEKLSEEQVIERHKPVTKKTGEYLRNLRCKVNTGGFYAVRYWDGERTRAEPPQDHTGLAYNAVVRLRSLWVSGEAWGLVCEATDLQVLAESVVDCPFA